ncbi:MAG: ribose 5-phosphate isomerase B [Bacteroidales bacterium]|nr:ribose 5-phosphate isomerase B [Bacteroidales bacterium]
MLILQPNKPLALCSDHAGYATKQVVIEYLKSQGIEYKDFGTYSEESCDYPDFAHACAEAVESGECYPGIGICGSGEGINMTLNKHQGIRSALCWKEEIARLARQHNDANVLAMPGRFLTNDEAIAIVKAFLSTEFEGGRHQRRIDKIPVKK